jgi:hypothetical protein
MSVRRRRRRRRRTMEDENITQELFFDSSLEDEHDSDSDQDKTRQDDTQWTDNTQSGHVAPVLHRFTGGPSGVSQ